MVVLTEKFQFIRDDVFLCPLVDSKTGKQKLVMQKINLKTKKIEFEDSIDCIHTAVTDISQEEFVDYQDDAHSKEYFYNKTLEIRSSENLKEINLTPKEKYIAFKSWVAGIAESGSDAFRVQTEIENLGNLAYPLSNFLLKFMIKIDSEYINEYITKIERECIYEGIKSESFILMSIMPIFKALYSNYSEQMVENQKIKIYKRPKLSEFDAQILERILENPTFNLKVDFLLKFPIYVIFIAHKMETDKKYLFNCIQRLISNKRKLIAFLIPVLKLLFKDYHYEEKKLFGEASDIIEGFGLPKKLMTQMYYKVYKIERSELDLYNRHFTDISTIPGLKYLTNLKVLSLSRNKITEIKGLGHLTKLTELSLGNNKITEIKGLENLKNLKRLYLGSNNITEIKGLENLKNLKRLALSCNNIKEIKGLENLTELKHLELEHNQISKIEGLDQSVNLEDLRLGVNLISKIEGLDQLSKLKILFLDHNQITKMERLNSLSSIVEIYLVGNKIDKVEGIDHLISLDRSSLFRVRGGN